MIYILLGVGTAYRADLQTYQWQLWMLNNPVANENFPEGE